MKLAIALFLAAFSLSAAKIGVTFNHDMGALPRCSATVSSNCMDHYEAGLMDGSTLTTLVNIPVPAGGAKLTGISGQFTTDKIGAVMVGVVAVGKGTTGNRTVSAPLTGNLNIDAVPNPPTDGRFNYVWEFALDLRGDVKVTARLVKSDEAPKP